jgi:hypothetical protein
MSEDELRAIEEVESKMTQGPWDEEANYGYWEIVGAPNEVGRPRVVCQSDHYVWRTQDDIDGVIALRNAAPALIAEVRRLRAALAEYEAAAAAGDTNGYGVARAAYGVARAALKGEA